MSILTFVERCVARFHHRSHRLIAISLALVLALLPLTQVADAAGQTAAWSSTETPVTLASHPACSLIDSREVVRLVQQRRSVRVAPSPMFQAAMRLRATNPAAYNAYLRATFPKVIPLVSARPTTETDLMNLRAAELIDLEGLSFAQVMQSCAASRQSIAPACNPIQVIGAPLVCSTPPPCPGRSGFYSDGVGAGGTQITYNRNWCNSGAKITNSFYNSSGSASGSGNMGSVMLSGLLGTNGPVPGISSSTVAIGSKTAPIFIGAPGYVPHNGWVSVANSTAYTNTPVVANMTSPDGNYGSGDLYSGGTGGTYIGAASAASDGGTLQTITVTASASPTITAKQAFSLVSSSFALIGASLAIAAACVAGVVVGITVGTVIALAAAVIAFVAAAANWVGSLLDAIGDDGDDPDVRVGRAESRAWSSRRYALLT